MRRGVIAGLVAGVLALTVAVVWFIFLRDDAPESLTLEGAIENVASTVRQDSEGAVDSRTDTAKVDITTDGLDGMWSIDSENSIVGYRIGEELATIGATDAVGRTSKVEGDLTVTGSSIESLAVDIDMTSLTSRSIRRDDWLRTNGLETEAFPTASFILTQPIDLGAIPTEGMAITSTATGELTLHGVTRTVQMPFEGTVIDGDILVVASVEIALSDYGIEQPTGLMVVSVDEIGMIEIQLAFSHRAVG